MAHVSPPTPPAKRSLASRLVCLIRRGVIGCLLLLLILFGLFHAPPVQNLLADFVAGQVTELTGRELIIGKLRLNLLRGSVLLEDASFGPPDIFPDIPYTGRVGEARINVDMWRTITDTKVHVESVLIRDPHLILHINDLNQNSIDPREPGPYDPTFVPKSPDESLAFLFEAVFLQEIDITGGRYSMFIEKAPLNLEVLDIELQGTWNAAKEIYELELRSPDVNMTIADDIVHIHGGITIPDVTFFRKGILAQGATLQFLDKYTHLRLDDAELRWLPDQPQLSAEARLFGELKEFPDIVRVDLPVEGKFVIHARMAGLAGEFDTFVTLDGHDLRSPWAYLDTLHMEGQLYTDRVIIHSSTASTLGGEVTSKGQVAWANDLQGLYLDGDVLGVDYELLAEFFQVPYPVPMSVDGSYFLRLDDFDVDTLTIQGNLWGEGVLPGLKSPLKLEAKGTLADMRVGLNHAQVRYRQFQVDVDGHVDIQPEPTANLSAKLASPHMQDVSQLLQGLLRQWTGESGFELTSVVPTGSLRADVDIKGPFNDLVISGTSNVGKTQFGNLDLESIATRFRLENSILSLDDTVIADRDGELTRGSITLDLMSLTQSLSREKSQSINPLEVLRQTLRNFPQFNAPIQIQDLDLGALLADQQELFAGLGRLSGQVDLRKSEVDGVPQGTFNLALGPGRIGPEYYTGADLSGTIEGEVLGFNAMIYSDDWGTQQIAGTIDMNGSLDLMIDAPSLELANIPQASRLGFSGKLGIDGKLTGTVDRPFFVGTIEGNDLFLRDTSLGMVGLTVEATETKANISGVLFDDQVHIDGNVSFAPDDDSFEFIVRFEELTYGRILRGILDDPDFPVTGLTTGRIIARGRTSALAETEVIVAIDETEVTLQDRVTFKSANFLDATYRQGLLAVKQLDLRHPQARITGNGTLDLDGPLDMDVDLFASLDLLKELDTPLTGAAGTFEIDFGLAGTAALPQLIAVLKLNARDVTFEGTENHPLVVNGDAQFSLLEGVFSLGRDVAGPRLPMTPQNIVRALQIDVNNLDVTGAITALRMGGILPYDPSDPFRVNGLVDLATVPAFLPIVSFAEGTMTIDGILVGTFLNPRIEATGDIVANTLRFNFLPWSMSSVRGEITWEDELIRMNSVTASVGRGQITANGTLFTQNFIPNQMDVEVAFNEVPYQYQRGVNLRAAGDLRLLGDFETPRIEGDVTLSRARYTQDINYQSYLLEQGYRFVIEGTRGIEVNEESEFTFNPTFQINLDAPSTLEVDNNLADIRASADLVLMGTFEEPVLNGIMEVDRGEIILQEESFTIQTGTIEFFDPNEINPYVNLTANGYINSYFLTIRVEGSFKDNFTIDLTSEPSLDQSDIYLLLLTGQTARGLQEGTNTSSSAQAASVLSGYLSGQLAKNLQALGIDRFSFEPSFAADQRFARVTVGKKIQDDLTIIFSTEVPASERQIILLRYNLTDNLSLVGERTEEGDFGGELRFRFQFR